MKYASQFSCEWIKVPLTVDHQYNLAGINEKLDGNTRLVFICNPNNPTGAELPRTMLEPFCETISARCTVYVDEAYIELSRDGKSSSLAPLTKHNKNIIVARTFSKIYGMAGLRIGYVIAHPDTIKTLESLMMGGNVTPSVTSVEAAAAVLTDHEFLNYCIEKNAETKEMTYDKFNTWGVEFIPSSTNFIFFRTERFGKVQITEALRQRNVMIRDYNDVPGWARVSMGTPEEFKTFLSECEGLLA
jgi:histidinol-phosphate aminotransferase